MTWRQRFGEFPWVEVLIIGGLAAVTRSPALIVLAAAGLVAWGLVELSGRIALVAIEVSARLGVDRLVAGEELPLEVVVVNRKPLPVPWLELRVELPEGIEPRDLAPGMPASSVGAGFAPRARERVRLVFPLRARRRGAYVVGPARLRAGDWLGFVQVERQVPIELTAIVYPAPIGVVDRHLPSLRPVTEAPTRRGLVPDPLRFRGVREYRGGDPRKEIHWKASARLRSLHTKLYEPATSLDAVFFVNVASYEQYWMQIDPEGAETVIAAAAELVRLAAGNGRQVGLVTNGLDNLTHERPRSALARGPRALSRCLEMLARLGPYAGASPEAVLMRERGRFASGATIIAVTTILSERLAAALVVLRRSGHRVLTITRTAAPAHVAEHLRGLDVAVVALDEAPARGSAPLRRVS